MIYIILADGFEEAEALVPLDLIRRAGLEIETAAVGASLNVKGAHGITVEADANISAAVKKGALPEAVILPGGMPGAKNLDASEDVSALLERTANGGGILAAICAAPMVLGKRGYLRGRKAVCYPGFEKYLDGAEIADAYAVTDEGGGYTVITGRAMGSAYDFGHALLAKLASEEAANAVYRSILK